MLGYVNETTVISLQLDYRETTKYPKADIYDSSGNVVYSVVLNHVSEGLYQNIVTITTTGIFSVVYQVYSDSGHTIIDNDYDTAISESLTVTTRDLPISEHINIANAVWDHNNAKYLLGLVQHNFRLVDQLYDADHRLTSAKIRIFGNSTDCNNNVNPIHEYGVTATYDANGECTSYKVVEL